MKILLRGILIILFGVLCNSTYAQPKEIITTVDTISFQDSILLDTEAPHKIRFPRKATIYSAVLPGLGQIYNKQTWKVPFIYGGFIGLGWTVNFYHQLYLDYFRAYIELTDLDPTTTFYNEKFEYEIDEFNDLSDAKDRFKTRIELYSRQRNLYIIGTAAFYLFNILDANVSAHLIDFDISEDLSCNFEPIAIDPLTNTPIFGATFSYNF